MRKYNFDHFIFRMYIMKYKYMKGLKKLLLEEIIEISLVCMTKLK
jgi:hypothetical protein